LRVQDEKHLLVGAGFLTVVAAGAAAGDFETAAIQARIDEASARGGGVVSIPAARHIVGQLDLRSNGFCGDPAWILWGQTLLAMVKILSE